MVFTSCCQYRAINLSVGTLDTLIVMPIYIEAIKILKDQVAESLSEKQEADSVGETSK